MPMFTIHWLRALSRRYSKTPSASRMLSFSQPIEIKFNELPPESRRHFADASLDFEYSNACAEVLPNWYPRPGLALKIIIGVSAALWIASTPWGHDPGPLFTSDSDLWLRTLGFLLLGILVPRRLDVWWSNRTRPYRRGTFVFPADIIIANYHTLTVIPMTFVKDVSLIDPSAFGSKRRQIQFTLNNEERIKFDMENEASAMLSLELLESQQQDLQVAAKVQDLKTLRRLDPLFDFKLGARNTEQDLSLQPSDAPRNRPLPPWFRPSLKLALLSSLIPLGVHIAKRQVYEHNTLKEIEAGTATSGQIQNYVNSGGKKADELRDTVLPEREAKEALQSGDIEELRTVLQRFPSSAAIAKVQAALDQKYETARERLTSHARDPGDSLVEFCKALLEWSHKDPRATLILYFEPNDSQSIVQLATLLHKNEDKIEAPWEYVDSDLRQLRERTEFVLRSGLEAIYGQPLVTMKDARHLRSSPVPALAALSIKFRFLPTLAMYQDEQERNFAQLAVELSVQATIPGVEEPFMFTLKGEAPDSLSVESEGHEVSAYGVYEEMLYQSALSIQKSMSMRVFSPESDLFKQLKQEELLDEGAHAQRDLKRRYLKRR